MADNLLIKDGGGNNRTIRATDNAGVHTPHHIIDGSLPAGTNNIGDVDILSIAAGDNNIGNVDIASIAAGDNNIGNVDVVTLPALAAGTNNIGDVDVLTVPADPFGANADAASATGSISAKLRFIASTGIPITGTVTVGSHAVTNAGTFATQVDGAALTALQLIDNIVAAEDAVAGSGYAGVPFLVVRQDSQTGLAADGDFISPTIDSAGGLRVSIVAGAGSGGTAAADDADFTAGSTSGTPVMGVRTDTPQTVTDGDLGIIRINENREIVVAAGAADATVGSTAGVRVFGFDANNAQIAGQAVDAALGTYPVLIGGRASTATPSAVSADNDAQLLWLTRNGAAVVSGDLVDDAAFTPGTSRVLMFGAQLDNTGTDSVDEGDGGALRMSANRNLYVNIRDNAGNERGLNIDASGFLTANINGTVTVGSHAVTNAGTFAVQVDGNALTALQLIDNPIVAHDAAISGSSGVNVIGLNARSADPTAVATADATQALATLLGKQVTLPYAISQATWQYASPSAVTDTADDAAKAAAGSGVYNYITGAQVFCNHATTGTVVVIKSASTVIHQGYAAPLGGGFTCVFPTPLKGGNNEAINVANITNSSSTYFNLQGYTSVET